MGDLRWVAPRRELRTEAERFAETLGIGTEYRAVMDGQMTVPELMEALRRELRMRWRRDAESEEEVISELFGPSDR